MGPFDIIKSITLKTELKDDTEFEAAYVPFLINKALSYYPDTWVYAREMNQASHLPKQMQYDFYYHSIPAGKRYTAWPRKVAADENLELIKQYFGYNTVKAKQALALLSDDQITKIKNRSSKGGIVE